VRKEFADRLPPGGSNRELWILGISRFARAKQRLSDGPFTRAELVFDRSGDHAGKEQSTECKLAAPPYHAPLIGGTRAADVLKAGDVRDPLQAGREPAPRATGLDV
jgi:hypothetical protein